MYASYTEHADTDFIAGYGSTVSVATTALTTVYTSTGKYCVTGITRQKIIDLCKKNKIKVKEKNFKLKEVLNADEAFCTGSFAGIVPVNQINKKKYSLEKNPITKELTNFYNNLF